MVKDAISTMSKASMPLVKWGSNSPEVAEILHQDFRDKYLDRELFKVLGLLWLASDDCFTFRGSVLAQNLCITKRIVLSFFSKLFDPLGFAAPYVLQAKCLFQKLSTLELGWDDEVPPEYQIRFLRWMGLVCWNRGESQGVTPQVAGMPFAACSFMHFQMHLPRLMELVCICELSSVIAQLCHLWSKLSFPIASVKSKLRRRDGLMVHGWTTRQIWSPGEFRLKNWWIRTYRCKVLGSWSKALGWWRTRWGHLVIILFSHTKPLMLR